MPAQGWGTRRGHGTLLRRLQGAPFTSTQHPAASPIPTTGSTPRPRGCPWGCCWGGVSPPWQHPPRLPAPRPAAAVAQRRSPPGPSKQTCRSRAVPSAAAAGSKADHETHGAENEAARSAAAPQPGNSQKTPTALSIALQAPFTRCPHSPTPTTKPESAPPPQPRSHGLGLHPAQRARD